MRTFRIYFDVPHSSFSVYKPYAAQVGTMRFTLRLPEGDSVVQIHDRRKVLNEQVVHDGLLAQVDLPSSNLDAACREAEQLLQAHLSLAVLQSDATVGQPRLWLAHETTSDSQTTEFIQIERPDSDVVDLSRRTRGVDHDQFNRLASAAYSSTDSHIARAIRWYRKGLIDDDAFDQFVNYWHGLETLNKSLMKEFGEASEIGACAACGAPYEIPTNKGIRALFTKYAPNGTADFKRCRDLRVDLQHGGESLVTIQGVIAEPAEICRTMLRLGIHLLLGYTPGDAQTSTLPIYNVMPSYYALRGTLDISPDQVNGILPFLEVQTVLGNTSSTDDQRVVEWDQRITFRVPGAYHLEATHVHEAGADVRVAKTQIIPYEPDQAHQHTLEQNLGGQAQPSGTEASDSGSST